MIAAGLLHDVLEKTDAVESDLRELFGPQIADLVVAMTEDERIAGYAARKAALRAQVAAAGPEALTLFAADKVSKVRELHLIATRPSARALTHYSRCLELLQARLPDAQLAAQLLHELERVAGSASAAAS